jgi:hypothetical protein
MYLLSFDAMVKLASWNKFEILPPLKCSGKIWVELLFLPLVFGRIHQEPLLA